MVCAGYLVELIFSVTGLIPSQRHATVLEASITWNYTTWLNIVFLALAAVLVIRFVRNDGVTMLKRMGEQPAHEGHRNQEHQSGQN